MKSTISTHFRIVMSTLFGRTPLYESRVGAKLTSGEAKQDNFDLVAPKELLTIKEYVLIVGTGPFDVTLTQIIMVSNSPVVTEVTTTVDKPFLMYGSFSKITIAPSTVELDDPPTSVSLQPEVCQITAIYS